MAEAIVRVQLLFVAPATFVLIGVAVERGGAWLALLAPASLILAGHARLVSRFPLRSWSGAAGNVGVLVALAAIAGLAVAPALGVYRTVTVLTGSMKPTFNPGDMIVVSPEPMRDLRVGDVITFQVPTDGHPVETHRIVSITNPGAEPIVTTKGDANTTLDPWHAQLHGATAWRYRFHLPGFGYPLLALRSHWVHWGTTLLLPVLLVLWGLGRLWLPVRRPRLTNV